VTVRIDIRKDRVTLESPWYPGVEVDAKMISGYSFAHTRKQWTYPLNMQTLRRLREVFGKKLVISPELRAWATKETRREKRLKGLSMVHDSALFHVPDVAPKLAEAMATRTYQRSGARFAATAGSFLLADEPGLGKTAQALAAAIEAQLWRGDILIVAPKTSLSSVWERQIKMWTGNPNVIAMPEGRPAREKAWELFLDMEDEPRILVINPAMLRRRYDRLCKHCELWERDVKAKRAEWPLEHHLKEHKLKRAIEHDEWPEIVDHSWTLVICDESHMQLANNTPSGIKTNMQLQGLIDAGNNAEQRYALTGTPLRGQELRIWGTLDWLSGQKLGGYWNFVDEYFEVANNGFGKEIRGVDPSARPELEKMIDRWMIRRTRVEARPDLPIGQRNYVLLEMSPKQRKQYEEFERAGEVAMESGAVSGQGVLSEMTRLKQMAYGVWNTRAHGQLEATDESPKLEALLQFLAERGITGTKVGDWLPEKGVGYKYVVASQLTEVLDAVERGLTKKKIKTLRIDGGVSQKRRNEAMRLFQSEDQEFRVVLIQTQTGGVAIELDAWCDEMVILDETFVADDQVQLEGRINNRSGRIAPRMWHYFVMGDTIEQKVSSQNVDQHRLQHELLDKRRGVKKALHLLKGN